MPSLQDLTNPPTAAQILQTQLALLALAGFPTTAWQSGSVPLTELQADAQTLQSLAGTIASIAAGGLLATAPALAPPGGVSPWMDLIALGNYGLTRKPAVPAIGQLVLTDVHSAGPFTITVGQLIASDANGNLFTNTTAGTIPKGGSPSPPLVFQAQVAGTASNAANGAITTLVTPLPGVTVSNPSIGGTNTWLTQQGVNVESDASLVLRCQGRWPGLGGGATTAVYTAWALTPTPNVTRVRVLENTPQGGQVTIYCAGPSGGASPADVATVQAYINGLRPLCVTVNVLAATNVLVAVAGTVTVASAFVSGFNSALNAAFNSYSTSLAVGGTPLQAGGNFGVPLAQLYEMIQSLPGVQNVNLTSPSGDTVLSLNQSATFSLSGLSVISN